MNVVIADVVIYEVLKTLHVVVTILDVNKHVLARHAIEPPLASLSFNVVVSFKSHHRHAASTSRTVPT